MKDIGSHWRYVSADSGLWHSFPGELDTLTAHISEILCAYDNGAFSERICIHQHLGHSRTTLNPLRTEDFFWTIQQRWTGVTNSQGPPACGCNFPETGLFVFLFSSFLFFPPPPLFNIKGFSFSYNLLEVEVSMTVGLLLVHPQPEDVPFGTLTLWRKVFYYTFHVCQNLDFNAELMGLNRAWGIKSKFP